MPRLVRVFAICLALAVCGRLLTFAAGWVAIEHVGYPEDFRRPPPTHESTLVDLPARWDTGWYVGVASGGYRWDGHPGRFENVAFFPAWPLLLRLAGRTAQLPLRPVPWNWAAVMLSTVLYAVALTYLWVLARIVIDPARAWTAVAFCACAPFGVYFGLPYTEALFLLVCVATTVHMIKGSYAWAVAFGLLAGLTRPNGFLLLVALLPIALGAWRSPRRYAALAAALSPLAGMAAYSVFVWHLTGSPTTWAAVQDGWGRAVQAPWSAYTSWFTSLATSPWSFVTTQPAALLNGLAGLVSLALAVPIAMRLGAGFGAFVVAGILLPLVGGGLPSLGRYSAVLFPLYLYAARSIPAHYVPAALIASGALALFVSGLFFTWRPIY